MEGLTVRRRNRLRNHFTLTSNVLLFGYRGLPDGAKLTYQVIDSFDWSDSAGLRKGFAHPSLARLAAIRGVEKRSIRRHLVDLEKVRLITREERPGRPSILWIEDPSELETVKYLEKFAGVGEDKDVRPTPDKDVRPYKKEEEPEERQILVNEEQALSKVGETGSLSNHRDGERLPSPVPKTKREYLAQEILGVVHDEKSLGYYRRVAETVEPHHIFEVLSEVRLASREGRIRASPGAYFTSLIKRTPMYSSQERSERQETGDDP